MAGATSNFPEIEAAILRISGSLNLNRRTRKGTVAGRLYEIVVEGIVDRTVVQQKNEAGNPLKRLARSTLRRKARLGQPEIAGVATGEMLSLKELRGRKVIGEKTAQMQYGDSPEAEEKAEWFQEGSAKGKRPKRSFYGFDRVTEQAMDDEVDAMLDEFLAEEGAT